MKRNMFILLLLMVAALFSSCRRDPLFEELGKYRIEINTVYDMKYNIPEKAPELYYVCFYNPTGHDLEHMCIVEGKGGYLYDVPAGRYDVVVYDYTFNKTNVVCDDKNVSYPYQYKDYMYARTGIVTYRDKNVVNVPDHLFVWKQDNVDIPHVTENDPSFVMKINPRSIVDSWLLVIDGIEGLQNVTEMNASITGHAQGIYFGRADNPDNPDEKFRKENVEIIFGTKADLDKGLVWTPFNTFGKIPSAKSQLFLYLYVKGSGGSEYEVNCDVTDQFDDPENTEHIIRAHFDIKIEGRTDGGFVPTTTPWEVEYEPIPIM